MASDKKEFNSAAAGVAGAIIGAAATAAAIALSSEKNRKKAEAILKDLQKEGNKVIKEISKRALELKDKSDDVLSKEEPKKIASKKK